MPFPHLDVTAGENQIWHGSVKLLWQRLLGYPFWPVVTQHTFYFFFFLLLLNGLNKNCGFQALLQLGFWKMCCLLTSWVFRDNGSCLYSGYWLHRIVFELGSLAISRSPHSRERQVLSEVSLVGKFVSVVATSHPFLGPSNHFCKLWIPGVLSISTSEVWFWSQEPICQSG